MPGKAAKPGQGQTDWAALQALSEDEIERMAVEDTDNPATVRDDAWTHATVYVPTGKMAIHATFDRDVVAFFKQGGRGYQTRMNAVLRRYMETQQAKKTGR